MTAETKSYEAGLKHGTHVYVVKDVSGGSDTVKGIYTSALKAVRSVHIRDDLVGHARTLRRGGKVLHGGNAIEKVMVQ